MRVAAPGDSSGDPVTNRATFPAMWNAAAEVTRWFDWSAVGALSTFLAFVAVWLQLGQGARERTQRDLATMVYLRNVLMTAAGLVGTIADKPAPMQDWARRAVVLGGFQQLIREFAQIRASDQPSPLAADAHHQGLMALEMADKSLGRIAAGEPGWAELFGQQRVDMLEIAGRMHVAIGALVKQRFPISWRFRELRPGQPLPSIGSPDAALGPNILPGT